MPRAPVLEKASSLRTLGAGFIVLLLFFVWLTWAFFSHAFTDRVTVYLKSQSAGLQLPMAADVKLRGMIVGEVSAIETAGNGVTLTLSLRPDAVQSIPAGVTAQIVPKTLFGQKYVALIPPDHRSADHIRAGVTIPRAKVPIEVEKLLNDIYPLLRAVQPAEVSYALSAISDALAGNGQQLGRTITTLNAYLTNLNPDVPTLIDDLRTLGTVSDVYADATPDLARLLGNAAVTSRTIVTQRQNLVSFFDNTEALAKTLQTFFKRSGNDLVALNKDARPVLDMVAYYSPSFPCFLAGMNKIIPREDSAFRGGKLHIDAEIQGPTTGPTGYTAADAPHVSQSALGASAVARPNCLQLNQMLDLADGDQGPFPQSHPFAYPDDSIYPLSGMATRHNKFCIPPPGWGGAWGPCDDAAFRAAAGSDAEGTPDIAAVLLQAGSG
jgi:phospholipid/cholesterol/gamma-HCH transport system substrate-binding protein